MLKLDNEIIELLKKNSSSSKETGNELIIRCPYCGDSSNPNKQHLYVKTVTDELSFPFHCFRCDTSGNLIKLLKDMNIFDVRLMSKLINSTHYSNYKFDESKPKSFSYSSKIDPIKAKYITDRLKLETLPEYISKFIVTDFSNYDTLSDGMKFILNQNYVGFATFNKKKIICRNTKNDNDYNRYITIRADNELDFFATIPDKINLLSEGKIVVAEGIFTLLAGYLKLRNDLKLNNTILVAGGGKSYLKAVKFAMYYFGVPDWDIYILADSDVNKSFFKNQFISLKSRTIKILYNDKNDFCDDYNKYSIVNLY
ncbi:MAG: hypothetical protein QW478_07045 [Candidatus Micrarchaeaceae archaeon]